MHFTLGELISSYDGKDLRKLSKDDEIALSKRARDGDLEARNRLAMEGRKTIPSAVWGYINNRLGMDAEDLAQDSFLEILEKGSQYNGAKNASFSTFAYTTAKRKAIDTYRRRKSRTRKIVEVENMDAIVSNSYGDDILNLKGFEEIVGRLKKERDREILRMRFVDDKKDDEIAYDISNMGYKPIKPVGVRTAIKRCLGKLRRLIC